MTEREKRIEENLGLVHACANRFRGRGVDYDDLYQAGCVGLIKAVDGFNEELGFVFSTYAVPAILGEIKRIFRDGGAVKVSRSLKERSREIFKQKEDFLNKNGYEPTVLELAEFVGLEPCEVSELLLITQPVLSLTVEDGENEEKQFDLSTENEEEILTERLSLNDCIEDLSEDDKLLIKLRYFGAKTQSEVAKEMHISQVQVSRREKKILKEFREKLTV